MGWKPMLVWNIFYLLSRLPISGVGGQAFSHGLWGITLGSLCFRDKHIAHYLALDLTLMHGSSVRSSNSLVGKCDFWNLA